MEWYLPVIWAGVLAIAVAMYVVLDGFDLGVGILFPMTHDEAERDVMMNSVAPFWDGNETWLVLGGGALWVAFPTAYAIIMPAHYLPVIGMLLALVLRGVSFEFRWVAKPRHRKWDIAFVVGSTLAAFFQGTILGSLLQGIEVVDGEFAGGAFDWLTAFSIFVGLAVVAGYGLLGAGWLIMRTRGAVQDLGRRCAIPLLAAVILAMAVVSLWTPLLAQVASAGFPHPISSSWPVPIATAAIALLTGTPSAPAGKSFPSSARSCSSCWAWAASGHALHRAAAPDHLGRRRLRQLADLPADRNGLPLPAGHRLHRLRLISRKGLAGRRLSLDRVNPVYIK